MRLNRKIASNRHVLSQHRHFFPIIIRAVVPLVVIGVVGRYAWRAVQRMVEEEEEESFGEKKESHRVDFHCCGIDIGSHSTKVAFQNANLIHLLESDDGKRVTDSAVFFDAGSIVAGEMARNRRWTKPNATIYGAINQIVGVSDNVPSDIVAFSSFSSGRTVTNTLNINGMAITPSSIYALLTKDLCNRIHCRSGLAFDTPINLRLTASIPNFCYDSASYGLSINEGIEMSSLSKNKSAAGINVMLVPDGIAAVTGACFSGDLPVDSQDNSDESSCCVLDVGGRVAQFGLVHLPCGDDILDEHFLSKGLVADYAMQNVGGDVMDEMLVQHLSLQFALANGIDVLQDSYAKQRLYEAVDAAKQDLSISSSTNISIPFITADQSGPKHLSTSLSRAQMNHIVEPQVQTIVKEFMHFVEDQLNEGHGISAILLVGGVARMSILNDMLADAMSKGDNTRNISIVCPLAPEEVVCIGATALGNMMR